MSAAPAAAPPAIQAPAPGPEPSKEDLLAKARAWAIESGFSEPLALNGPERIEYPRFGHGYAVTISEQNAPGRARKTRMGTARFSSSGERSMWTMDGSVVL